MRGKGKVNEHRRSLLTAFVAGTAYGIAPRLALPAQAAHAAEWLPIEMPDHRRIIIDGTVNDTPTRIVLDTGDGPLVLDQAFAQGLATTGAADLNAKDMTGVISGRAGGVVRLRIGPATLDDLPVAIFDLAGFNMALPRPVHAIVGRDLFDRFAIEIDFANTRLRFPAAAELGAFADAIALGRCERNLRTVDVSIEGHPAVSAMLDSGADRALYLSAAYAGAQGLLTGRKTSTALSGGLAGQQLSTVAVVDSLAMGPTTFHDLPIEVPPAWTFDVPAIVGLPIIRRFSRLVFDFPRDRVVIPTGVRPSAEVFRKDRTGLGVVLAGDCLQIVHVADNSPAALAGLRIGDEILAVDGVPCDRLYLAAHGRDGAKPAGTVLVLTLKNGIKTPLRLADYF
jgi:hypothetical protein